MTLGLLREKHPDLHYRLFHSYNDFQGGYFADFNSYSLKDLLHKFAGPTEGHRRFCSHIKGVILILEQSQKSEAKKNG